MKKEEKKFPTPHKIALTRYWKLLFYHGLESRISFDKTITNKEGMSKTDMQTFSAQIGIKWGALSSQISSSFSSSTTISEEKSVTDNYKAKLNEGETGAFTLWQLIEEYSVVDENDKPIEWVGRAWVQHKSKKTGPHWSRLKQTYFPVKTPFYAATIWGLTV